MAKSYSQAQVEEIIAERDALRSILAGNFGAIINLFVCLDEPGTDAEKLLAVKKTLEMMVEPGGAFAPNFKVLHLPAEPGEH